MARTSYTGAAPTLSANATINSGDLSFTSSSSAAGYPDGSIAPFTVTLDLGKVTEEKVLCSSRAGNVFTVSARGYDGTTAQAHTQASIDLTMTAVVVQDNVDHVYVTGRDDHTQYMNNGRHDAHSHVGVAGVGSSNLALTATSTDIKAVAATGALGALSTAAPADHVHKGLIDTSQDVLAWMSA